MPKWPFLKMRLSREPSILRRNMGAEFTGTARNHWLVERFRSHMIATLLTLEGKCLHRWARSAHVGSHLPHTWPSDDRHIAAITIGGSLCFFLQSIKTNSRSPTPLFSFLD